MTCAWPSNVQAAIYAQVYGDGSTDARGWSRFAFRPGFINFVGEDPVDATTLLSKVAAGAQHERCTAAHIVQTLSGWHLPKTDALPPRSNVWMCCCRCGAGGQSASA